VNFIVIAAGAIIGSFLNVCIFRLPSGSSLISPGSSCPYCSAKIRFFDNIPVISYIILFGKCRRCARRISIVYPVVEIMMSFFAYTLYLKYGITVKTLLLFVLISALVVVSFIDLKHYIIPDSISIPGVIVGFLTSFIQGAAVHPLESISGLLLGGFSLLFIGLIYEKLTGREGIGGGDIKLLAMIGAFLGYKNVLLILFLSSVVGAVIGVLLMIFVRDRSRHSLIPFGPFLSFAAVVAVYYGEEIISSYLQLFYA